jgi:alcohol dehydrogenase class IV
VLTDTAEQRKLGLGSYELVPDVAVVDPALVASLPPHITADTGMDALTHAIEGYTSTCHNDFCDGLCLKAAQLVFDYLPRAFHNGCDSEAREHMHNAATIAGLGFGNSMAALAHSMGHALGAIFHTPHGQAVGLFLPYTIQFSAKRDGSRYAEIARFLGHPAQDEPSGAANLVAAIADLQQELGQPRCIRDLGIDHDSFEAAIPSLIANAESDTALVMSTRIPGSDELARLFRCAYQGQTVDF